MSKDKKTLQLGMHPSTAAGRLVKDTLFRLAVDAGHKCYRCGEALTRETFSIEHKEDWLDSGDPKGLYFDQDNIAFSHLTCNISNSKGGIEAAKERMMGRYHDRDEAEANRMESFRGLSKEQLKERFEVAARERGIKLAQEKKNSNRRLQGIN